MEFELGQTYSGYEFMAVLRQSANATEYHVRNTVAGRDELLHAANVGAEAAVMRQARILARLAHPNIIAFYAAQPIEGRLAMSSERPGPATLADRLGEGPLDWHEALDIAAQVLAAIGFLHTQGIAHLAITSDAIAFCDGVWKIAGFEAAQFVEGGIASSGSVNGNARYLAPEQVKGGTLDARTDLYSWGAVLYEALCGGPPFESKSQFELLLAHVNQSPAPPSIRCARVPMELDEVVLRALRKDPAERYASAEEFAAALREAAERCAAVVEETVEPALVMAPETVADATAEPMIEPPLQPAVVADATELDVTCAADIVAASVDTTLETAVVVEEALAYVAVPPQEPAKETVVSAEIVEPGLAAEAAGGHLTAETSVVTAAGSCIEAAVVEETPDVVSAGEPEVLQSLAEPLIGSKAPPQASEPHLAVETSVGTAAELPLDAVVVVQSSEGVAETEPEVLAASEQLIDPANLAQAEPPLVMEAGIATAAELSIEAVTETEPDVPAASARPLIEATSLKQAEPAFAMEPGIATAAELSIEAAVVAQSFELVDEPEVIDASVEPLIAPATLAQTSEPHLTAQAEIAPPLTESASVAPVVANSSLQPSEPVKTTELQVVEAVSTVPVDPQVAAQVCETALVVALDSTEVSTQASVDTPTIASAETLEEPVAVVAAEPPAVTSAVTAEVTTEPIDTQAHNTDAPTPAQQPDPALQAALWAAAVAVASAASATPAAAPEPVSVVPLAAPLVADAVTDTRFPLPAEPLQRPIPPPIRMPPPPPDAVHWIMFGSAAAFLGIVWVAIIFSMH